MKKLLLALVLVAFASPAFAKSHHKHHAYRHHAHHRYASYDGGSVVAHPSGCPWHAFCGCAASVRIFGHPVAHLALASNWFGFQRAAAAPGMVAVRNHHVFVIEAVHGDGTVTAYDGNSGGHLTRVHRISLAGYTVVNPHGGSRVAMRERRHARYAHHYHHRRVHYASGV